MRTTRSSCSSSGTGSTGKPKHSYRLPDCKWVEGGRGSFKKKKTRLLKEELNLGDFNLGEVGLGWKYWIFCSFVMFLEVWKRGRFFGGSGVLQLPK